MSKFIIEEINDLNKWDNFIIQSLEYTIFVNSIYLTSYGGKYKLFFVKKNNELKAGFCILLSDNERKIILDDLVIYTGILFKYDNTQKKVKARSERFEITETIINFLTDKFNHIEMALTVGFEDMRPFLWHNYHSSNIEDKFSLNLRYTSYLDISELKGSKDEEKTNLFKNLETLRQRNIRKARKEKAYIVEELNTDLFIEYYIDLMDKQNQNVSDTKLKNMKNIINNLIEEKQATMVITKNSKDEILYIIIFCFDKYRAYYLFGAGNPKAKEHYKGTICFWDGFKILSNKYDIKEIDMEGINSPQRGWFKLSFGGDIRPYYQIKYSKEK